MNPSDPTPTEHPDTPKTSSRRQVLGKIGAGLFAATTLPALAPAQQAAAAVRAPAQSVKRNPLTQYPRPPFPAQSQPWPGLAGKMTPRPDHGETSYQGTGRLLGRKALITGGDSGIGRAAAIAYAREGADVAINYLPAEEADAREVVALIRAAGRKAVAIPGDLRDEAFCKRLVTEAARQLGGLDILVSNAARQQAVDSILDLTTENFDWTMKTNLYAMFWLAKAAVPLMQPGAVIITTTSVQAYDPSDNLLDYAQTKAAQVAFTKSLAKQLAPKGIRVNAVAPGPFWTPLQVTGGQPTSALPQFGAQTPIGRAGQPAELAGLYVVLASQETSYSTGQVFGGSGGAGNP
ncbi:SDR family oxidoreductase [Deinococcus sp. Leaf326]|uniref:SDR family oxidoreductase n=1 Tax=Deinococcus sp. Leaf326 TaxID=1736338 RepID=UPI0006FF00F6|nr:SDR family oxidoreductase [Deinococcus sp. Leaf326]KQR15620.1 NAD(P)-dependent oxidoreductase [Deinococcus sp. Leaf326]